MMNKRILLLTVLMLSLLLIPDVFATGCGTAPAGVTSCIPVNLVSAGTVTPTGYDVQLLNLPVNILVGNVLVYNGLSGGTFNCVGEAPTNAFCNLGANVIPAGGSFNGIMYLGIASTNNEFYFGNNGIGYEAYLDGYAHCNYDTGNIVFPIYYDFCGTSTPSGITLEKLGGNPATFNNGMDFAGTTAGDAPLGYTAATMWPAGNVVQAYWSTTGTIDNIGWTDNPTQNGGYDAGQGALTDAVDAKRHTTAADGGSAAMNGGSSTIQAWGSNIGAPLILSMDWTAQSSSTAYQNVPSVYVLGDAVTHTSGQYTMALSHVWIGVYGGDSEVSYWIRVMSDVAQPTVVYGAQKQATAQEHKSFWKAITDPFALDAKTGSDRKRTFTEHWRSACMCPDAEERIDIIKAHRDKQGHLLPSKEWDE